MSLGSKILGAMMIIIALSFAGSLLVAFQTAQSQDELYNSQRLERKERAIGRSLEYVIDGYDERELGPERLAALMNDRICELAEIHDLTISIYTLDGLKITSSAVTGTRYRVPPAVLAEILNKTRTSDEEEIGMDIDFGDYVEAFWRVDSQSAKPLAVVGLKYEKRQVEGGEFADFFMGLAPVYAGLFLMTGLLALVLASTITQPIRRLTQDMAQLNPTEFQPRPLDYSGQDDIGQLVVAYNKLQAELGAKIAELARTERESAWRLMAMQVAHEIKNPLTPLRLGLQQLLRAWNDQRPDFGERLNRYSTTADAQIEVLNTIASDFSMLAELNPSLGASESARLEEVVEESVELWKSANSKDVEWSVSMETEGCVRGKKSHLIRVLNNLLSNAVHAVGEQQNARIDVLVRSISVDSVQIRVRDSGPGIPKNEQERVFEPRFTTKSQGTGMGLAMVRSIVRQYGGDVGLANGGAGGACFVVTLRRVACVG